MDYVKESKLKSLSSHYINIKADVQSVKFTIPKLYESVLVVNVSCEQDLTIEKI